ncbi:hypothetical protein Stsp01_47730 [Streptomyces sp. NBRC 13847]|nr:hypothetical protein Stsp01_47730 [Streptomyces sp. NBRC 13847]
MEWIADFAQQNAAGTFGGTGTSGREPVRRVVAPDARGLTGGNECARGRVPGQGDR